MSVYLGSQLRSMFQKTDANQKRIADRAETREKKRLAWIEAKLNAPEKALTNAAAKTPAKAAAPARRPEKAAPKAGSTIATAEGVVIAEQRHIDATKAV